MLSDDRFPYRTRGELLEVTLSRARAIKSRRRKRHAVAASAAVVLVGILVSFAASDDPKNRVATGAARPDGSGTSATATTDAGTVGVSDHEGNLRGYIDLHADPTVALANGVLATPVRDVDGAVVGYFVSGHLGFVDLTTADDARLLDELEFCYEQYTTQLTASDHCTDLLSAQGVDTTP